MREEFGGETEVFGEDRARDVAEEVGEEEGGVFAEVAGVED